MGVLEAGPGGGLEGSPGVLDLARRGFPQNTHVLLGMVFFITVFFSMVFCNMRTLGACFVGLIRTPWGLSLAAVSRTHRGSRVPEVERAFDSSARRRVLGLAWRGASRDARVLLGMGALRT